jgi:hypothetical protein
MDLSDLDDVAVSLNTIDDLKISTIDELLDYWLRQIRKGIAEPEAGT